MREADLTKENKYKSPFSIGDYVESGEIKRNFTFSKEVYEELHYYLETIALKAWKGFEPKDVDSIGAEYDEYYDKEFDDNGYCSITKEKLCLTAPNQLKDNGSCIRLFKFNKRKFESFIYDFRKVLGH